MSSQFFLMLSPFFLIPFLLLLLIKPRNKTVEARRLPPGPKKLPFIGNLHQLGNLPHRSLGHLSNEYGPLMFLKLGSVPTLVISSADMAREIFKTNDRAFSGRPVLYAASKFSYNCSSISLAPYGEYWREVRKIAMIELFSAKRVQSFEAVREEEVTLMVDSIAHSTSTPVNLSELMLLLANNIVCRAVFSRKSDEKRENGKNKFDETLHQIQDLLGGFCVADYFPWMGWFNKFNGLEERVGKNFRELDRLYDTVLEEHLDPERPEREHQDLVDVLLRVQKDPSQAIRLNNEQIKAVLTDMFIAGTDTSSATLVWIMAELIRNPSVMRKAQEEVREFVKGKGKVEEGDISKLVYLNLVIKETLRLHPPAPLSVPRETIESCTIRGYEIPAKTRVFFNLKSIGTDPKCWENPNAYRPERFLDSSIDFNGQNFELLPFGAGRRGCPGINFGVVVIELALANLLYHFDWKLPQGVSPEDIDMEGAIGITMHKKTPLCLVATPIYV